MAWIDLMARITLAEAKRQNWPRPTCEICYTPCRFDYYFRTMSRCPSCFMEEPIIIKKKEMPCPPPS